MSASESIEIVVPDEEAGQRLDRLLADRLEVSRSQLEKHIESGAVSVNGAPPARGKSTPLPAGAVVRYQPPPPEPIGVVPEKMDLEVLFEDEHLLVLDKPAGVVVHPGEGNHHGTLLAGVLHHVGRLPDTDPVRPGVVHRLDKGTTGAIVFAKGVEVHAKLVDAFRARQVKKTYLAITQGVPKPSEGTFETLYGRDPHHRQRFSSKVLEGKEAITHYEVLEVYPGVASVQVGLQTGRTHQIRVHFADSGHPLVGEDTYGRGGTVRDPMARQVCAQMKRPALHAWELAFPHPVTGRKLHFVAPMPKDMIQLVEDLRRLAELRARP